MIALSEALTDAGLLAAIVSGLVGAGYALARSTRDIAHVVRSVADIPTRIERLENVTTAFDARLSRHLADEEEAGERMNVALASLARDVATLVERRAEVRQ